MFPDTAVAWEPVLSAKAWFEGANGQHRLLSLQPPGMTPGRVRNKTGRRQGRRSGQGWKEEQGAQVLSFIPETTETSGSPKSVEHVSRSSL